MNHYFLRIQSEHSDNYRLINISQIEEICVNTNRQGIKIITTSGRTHCVEGQHAKEVLKDLENLMKYQGCMVSFELNQQTEEQV